MKKIILFIAMIMMLFSSAYADELTFDLSTLTAVNPSVPATYNSSENRYYLYQTGDSLDDLLAYEWLDLSFIDNVEGYTDLSTLSNLNQYTINFTYGLPNRDTTNNLIAFAVSSNSDFLQSDPALDSISQMFYGAILYDGGSQDFPFFWDDSVGGTTTPSNELLINSAGNNMDIFTLSYNVDKISETINIKIYDANSVLVSNDTFVLNSIDLGLYTAIDFNFAYKPTTPFQAETDFYVQEITLFSNEINITTAPPEEPEENNESNDMFTSTGQVIAGGFSMIGTITGAITGLLSGDLFLLLIIGGFIILITGVIGVIGVMIKNSIKGNVKK